MANGAGIFNAGFAPHEKSMLRSEAVYQPKNEPYYGLSHFSFPQFSLRDHLSGRSFVT
jgi:hypothetical protein